jgi:DNA helicase INO80
MWKESCLSRPEVKLYVPPVLAPPIGLYCRDRSYLEKITTTIEAPLESLAFYGMPLSLKEYPLDYEYFQAKLPGVSPHGLLAESTSDQLPWSPMRVPEAKKLIYDSAKLSRLDSLLQELKANDHRVLIYSQMTRMLDLLEEYLIYRQYKYLRLDGSSKLEDRRDMVNDWQNR